MSMARLWRDQGKRDEARELLAPVYGWFSPRASICTPVLQEANALLEQLHVVSEVCNWLDGIGLAQAARSRRQGSRAGAPLRVEAEAAGALALRRDPIVDFQQPAQAEFGGNGETKNQEH